MGAARANGELGEDALAAAGSAGAEREGCSYASAKSVVGE